MRTLVTGGAGFIGGHLVNALVAAGDEVVVLDNLRRGAVGVVPQSARFLEGDIRDRDAVRQAMTGCERVYHLAAQSNVLGAIADLEYSFSSNVIGTYTVLACAAEAGIKRMVFTSSREAYGEVETLPVSEDHLTTPKNAYGASKVAGEVYCRTFQAMYHFEVNVVRLANVYGEGDRDRVIPLWLGHATRNEPLELFGGNQVLDFIPIDFVVAALLRAGAMSFNAQPVNVGSGHGTTLRELAARIQALPGVSSEIVISPARPAEVTRFVADTRRMRAMLQVQPPADPLARLEAMWDARRKRDVPSVPPA